MKKLTLRPTPREDAVAAKNENGFWYTAPNGELWFIPTEGSRGFQKPEKISNGGDVKGLGNIGSDFQLIYTGYKLELTF
ncbi:MAG: hypothetical protein Unbinned2691contig1000_48 [Prokaryotic dsDNA virus sp.]|nr:MAG: hypothetical protein Unbinned2691contig1000_48 [Prokaryotic dsDNA virus sp.]|tara:strand:- start:9025 stop:9261 length:237 start_codon:yes stop_codon:yes gene_type:complete